MIGRILCALGRHDWGYILGEVPDTNKSSGIVRTELTHRLCQRCPRVDRDVSPTFYSYRWFPVHDPQSVRLQLLTEDGKDR